MPATTDLHTDHLDEREVIAEDSSKAVLNADATGDIELQSELEQEALIPSPQETGVDALTVHEVETEADVVSSNKDALTAQKVEAEVEAGTQGTDAATTTNELAAVEPSEVEQLVVPTTEVFIFCPCLTCSLTWFYL